MKVVQEYKYPCDFQKPSQDDSGTVTTGYCDANLNQPTRAGLTLILPVLQNYSSDRVELAVLADE